MKKDDLLHFYRNFQIIDVTKECKFEWVKEPEPCKAYLEVSNTTGDFTEGETIQGQSSGATATVFSSYVDGGRVYVEDVSGSFQEGETIQGQSSGQTAIVDKFVEERSYPNNIIKGAFPDSFLNDDPEDYFEFESARTGSGVCADMFVSFADNKERIATVIFEGGIGERISSCNSQKYIYGAFIPFPPHYSTYAIGYYHLSSDVCSVKFGARYLFGIGKWYRCRLLFETTDKNILRWRIYRIRVLEFVV